MAVLLVLLASGSCVFAADENNEYANLTAENTDDFLEVDNSQSSHVLSDDSATFTDLNTVINNAGDVLELHKNYTYNSARDNNFKNGITINKKITIQGNGYTIDASNSARIFNIIADGVILNNISIKNAFLKTSLSYFESSKSNENISIANGAGIIWSGNNGVLNNSIIKNNAITVNVTIWNTSDINVGYYIGNGAGIFWTGDNAIIENTKFINNTIKSDFTRKYNTYNLTNYNNTIIISTGSSIYMGGNNSIVRKSQFIENKLCDYNNYVDDNDKNTNINTLTDSLGKSYSNITVLPGVGSVHWMGDNGFIEDSQFHYNNASIGASIYWSGDNGTVLNNIFKNNFNNNTGNVYWSGDDGKIINSSFVNNTAVVNGAGIYWGGKNGVLSNSVFNNNTGSASGAVVSWPGNNALIINSKFNNNTGNDSAIFSLSSWDAKVINSSFINNYARTYGGALYTYLSSSIINSTFINNTVANYGGAISSSAVLYIFNSTFINNTARYFGGAIFYQASSREIIVNNSKFIDNHAGSTGGALHSHGGTIYTFNSSFINNTAVNSGGAINMYLGGLIVNLSSFSSNSAKTGGVINVDNRCRYLVVCGSEFSNDSAVNYNSSGIYSSVPSVYIASNNNFNNDGVNVNDAILLEDRDFYISPNGKSEGETRDGNNYANFTYALSKIMPGHTIYFTEGVYTDIPDIIINKEIKLIGLGNVVIDLNNGGSFTLNGAINSIIKNIIFKNSKKTVIDWTSDYGVLINSTFIDNIGWYGAVRWIGSFGKVINSSFINNAGTGSAGALYWTGAFGEVCNSNFTNNSANVVNDIFFSTELNITHNRFVGSYLSIAKNVLMGDENAFITITSSNIDVEASILINGELYNKTMIYSNTSGAVEIHFPELSKNVYSIDVLFSSGDNYYRNNVVKRFNLINESLIIYVSPNGGFDGSDSDHPTTIDDALNMIVSNSTIIMLNGTYNLFNKLINTHNIFINGSGNTYIDAESKGMILTVSGENSVINNIIFINGNSTSSALIINGVNSKIINCTFINNTGSDGGAVRVNGMDSLIINSIFINNYGSNGGAVKWNAINGEIINCSFINNTAGSSSGGAVYWGGDNGTIEGSVFVNSSGLAVFWNSVGGRIINSSFINNTGNSNMYGGAIRLTGSYSIVVNSSFINNNALSNHGGAISINALNIQIINSRFISNSARSYGQAIIVESSNLVIINSTFINHTGWDTVDLHSGRNNTIINSTFINNYGSDGVVDMRGTYCTVNGSTFINNTGATTGGSGAYAKVVNSIFLNTSRIIFNGANFLLLNSTFNGCTGVNGAVSVSGVNSTIADSFFIGCNGSVYGGALRFTSSNGEIINCSFINNYGSTHGGAISMGTMGGAKNIVNCTFVNNSVGSGYGAAILVESGPVNIVNSIFIANNKGNAVIRLHSGTNHTIVNCSFINNTIINNVAVPARDSKIINSTFIGNYRSVAWEGSNGTISGSTFINNDGRVNYGSAVYWSGSNGTIMDSTFIGNHNTATYGGAVYSGGGLERIINSSFINNTGTDGGAICFTGDSVVCSIVNSTFVGNYARSEGGAILITGGHIFISNSIFMNNTASGNGGAVNLFGGSGHTIYHSTFVNNTATIGSAIYIRVSSSVEVNNSEFLDNKANRSSLLYSIDGDSFTLTFSSGDNYVNAIRDDTDSIELVNITYWNGSCKVNSDDVGSSVRSIGGNQVLVIDLTDVGSGDIISWVNLTDASGKVTNNLSGNYYYLIDAYHGVGPTRSIGVNFEMSSDDKIVPSLNVAVDGDIYSGDNVTFTANINNNITGNITFIINNNEYSRVIDNGVSTLTIPVYLLAGDYNVTVVFNSSDRYHSQRNSTVFSVKVASNPNIYIGLLPNTVNNGTTLNLTALSNFNNNAISVLQFVVPTNT